MSQRVNIPSQNQPFRRQSSIGGNVSFRNIGENEDNSFITLAKVTRVYYKQGKLDFKLTNTNSLVADQSGNGSGSAPIPVDFFGRRPNGKVFGHYRPVKIGDLIAVAYVNGHKSSPIVIGVYPNSGQDYEIISPSLYLDGDDNNSGVAETALAEQKIYPSMQLEYRSGSGTIAKALNGHSFLVVDDETSVQYSKLWQNYNTVGFFHSNSDDINPLKETAGDWLLIHEDNPLSDDGDNHRTRFFVNKKGEIQIVLMDNTSSGTISVLEGSKDNGFTISQYYDLTKTKSGDLSDDVYEPDFKSATDYVSLNIGKGKQIALDAAGQTKLIIKKDGIYYNGKPLSKAVINDESNSITNYVKDQITSSDDWKNFQDTINKASSEARAAAEQAKQAGEGAKDAGLTAEKVGDDAKKTGDYIKKNVIYYANKYKGLHPGLHLDGGIVAITGKSYIEDSVIGSAMIEDGAIDHAKIAYEAVGSSQIEDSAITRAKIGYAAIGSAQIEDLAVTDAKIGSLSADKITTGTLDAGKINVVNLNAKSIKAGTITADKLKIGQLSDITGDAGQITGGKIIVKGNGKNSGVSLEGLDADNPDVYTPSKKAALANIVHAIKSSAEASLDYAKQVGLSNDPAAIDLQNKYDAMVSGLAPIFNDMSVSTNFDHNTVERLTFECNNAIDKFQNLANSQLNRKIGQTADNKNSVYQGYEQPANPHNNDIWFQENSDGTYQIRVYDGGSWISPGMQDIKEVQKSVSTLPRSYYSSTQPTGTDYKDGDTWYKTSTDTTNNTVVYTAYKWNHNTNIWDPLLDATSSHNYIGSAPVNPINGDFWMDNTTLKQYQNGVWKTIPTQGPQGIPGVNAKQQYIHIAYATSADGKNNFSVDSFSGATYIGLLVDFNEEDSKDPTKYTWSLMKGTDGTDGKDGVPGKSGADGKTSYVHFAYANSSDGKTDFSVKYFDNALYIGTYTDFTEEDSTTYTDYTWSRLKGDQGDQGIRGPVGADGKSSYTHIAYANSSDGKTDFTVSDSNRTYIGMYVDFTATDSNDPTKYAWSLIKGADGKDGTPGKAGADGKTPYFHIAYADSSDGKTNFSLDTPGSRKYIGSYTDFTQADSNNPALYSWQLVQGPKGDQGNQGIPGKPGADGKTYYTWIKYATDSSGSNISDSPTGMSYIGIAPNKESKTESSTPTDYTWSLIKGADGIPGPPGADGKTSYFHIAYANSADGKKGFYVGGGVNLLQGTGTASGDVANGGGIFAQGAFNGYDAVWSNTAWSERYLNLSSALGRTNAKSGDWFTISVYVKADKQIDTGSLNVYRALGNVDANANDGHLDAIQMSNKPITTQWQQYAWSFQINNISLQRQNTRVEYNYDTSDNRIYWAGWMLEKGTVAHPWSPAPSEVHPLYIGTYTDYTRAGSTDPTRYTWAPMFDSTKKRNFTSQPTTPYAVGDTWTESGATYFCTTAKDSGAFDQKDWEMQQLTIQSLDSNVQTNLKNNVKTNENYKGVTLNDNGLTATAGSTTVAMNSNDGFLIRKKDGGEVFHVDTNGSLALKGDITAGHSPNSTISGVNFIGKSLTLSGDLHINGGSILVDSGDKDNKDNSHLVVLNNNGLTLKNGGLSIIGKKDGKTITTTWIRDDGTFSTIQGDFAGTVKATSLTLTGEEAYMDVGAGKFHVYSNGNVTATSISITGNRKAEVNNSASLNGVSIYNGSVIEGSFIKGSQITGGKIRGSRFETNAYAQNYGAKPPYAGYGTESGSLVSLGSWDESGLVIRNNVIDLQKTLSWSNTDGTHDQFKWLTYPHNNVTGAGNYLFVSNYGEDFQRLSGYDVEDTRNNNYPNHMFIPLLIVNNRKDLQSLNIDYYIRTNTDANVYMISWCTDLDKRITVDFHDRPEVTGMSTPPDRLPNENSLINKASMHRANDSIQLFSDSIDIGSKGSNNIGVGLWVEKVGSTGDHLYDTYVAGSSLAQVGKDHSWNLANNFQVHHQRTTITNNANFIQESYDESGASRNTIMNNGRLQLTNSEGPNVSTNTFRVDGSGISFSDNALAMNSADANQKIAFLGNHQQGIYFDSYGNIHGLEGSGYWRIKNKRGTSLVDFPMNENNPITFNKRVILHTGGECDITTTWVAASSLYNGAHLPAIGRSDWWNIGAKSGMIAIASESMYYFSGHQYWRFNWGPSGTSNSWGTGSD